MKKHLKFVDSLGCCICGSRFATHHHLLRVRPEFAPPKKGEELFNSESEVKGNGNKIRRSVLFAVMWKVSF